MLFPVSTSSKQLWVVRTRREDPRPDHLAQIQENHRNPTDRIPQRRIDLDGCPRRLLVCSFGGVPTNFRSILQVDIVAALDRLGFLVYGGWDAHFVSMSG
jgi:hypothetical protein